MEAYIRPAGFPVSARKRNVSFSNSFRVGRWPPVSPSPPPRHFVVVSESLMRGERGYVYILCSGPAACGTSHGREKGRGNFRDCCFQTVGKQTTVLFMSRYHRHPGQFASSRLRVSLFPLLAPLPLFFLSFFEAEARDKRHVCFPPTQVIQRPFFLSFLFPGGRRG